MNAIFSAGVAYAITKACSSNKFESCTCDRSKEDTNGVQWHQCNDNVRFGVEMARKFIDSVETSWGVERMYASHAKILMNLHNNKVGRTVSIMNIYINSLII